MFLNFYISFVEYLIILKHSIMLCQFNAFTWKIRKTKLSVFYTIFFLIFLKLQLNVQCVALIFKNWIIIMHLCNQPYHNISSLSTIYGLFIYAWKYPYHNRFTKDGEHTLKKIIRYGVIFLKRRRTNSDQDNNNKTLIRFIIEIFSWDFLKNIDIISN